MAKKGGAVSVGSLEAFLGLDDSEFIRGITNAQRTLNNVGKQMTQIGKTLTTFVSLPLLAAGGASIKSAMDFEKAFSEIEGLVGVARKEVTMFRKEILAMSGDTSRPPQELADALYFVTSAGISGADALEVVKNAGMAAAAGLGNTAAIADLVSSAVNAYGIENLSAAKATDILVAAVREGKAEAPAMATALGYVLPISSQMGVEFEEVAAAVAAMTRTGTDASTATTNLRQILSDLLSPTKQAREAMKKMGTSASELRKALREDGLMSVLGFLREQMKTNEEAMSQVFGNVRALSGALDLMGENAQSNIQVFENLKNTTGDMQRAFDAASGSSTFKFNQAMAELKVASIDLGAALMPIFLDLVKVVKNLATWFTSLSTQSKRMVIMIGALAAAAGPALIVMGSMITVLTALSPVILAVVAAVGALAASFIYVYENWEAIKERVSDWGWWRNMLIDMIQFLVKYNPASMFIKSILDGWNWMAQKSGGIFRMWDFTIPDPFELAIEGLETLKAETTEYKHQFGSFTEAISSFAKRAGQAIAGMFPGGGGGGGGAAVSSLPAPVRNAAVLTPFTPKVNQDKRIFKDVIERDPALRERLIGPLKEAQQALDQLNATFEQMITGTIVEFGMAIGEMFAGNSNSMKTFLDGLMGQVANFMKMFGEALIASAFAAEAFQKLLSNPFAAIAAGSALIIAAGVVRGLLKKGPGGGGGGGGGRVQGLATGGVVTSGGVFQLHKDEMVALPRGAAVTPAHMVNGGGTGAGGGLSTSFGLRKMIIQLDRERERMKR